MKQFLVFGCLLFCFSLPACQCSDKPEVGPVEEATVEVVTTVAPRSIV
ncbi:MAG: hypothetical protein ACE5G0_11015 [Rhodothermales bacterium]